MFNLNIHNFRSFQNQNFSFKRINILIGENSGGKSSLLKFLLSLKQTLDSPYESNLKLRGDYTDLGNYEEVIYKRNKKLKLSFTFSSEGIEYMKYFKEFTSDIGRLEKEGESFKEFLRDITEGKTSVSFEINSKLGDHSSIVSNIENSQIGKIKVTTKKINTTENTRSFNSDISFTLNNEISGKIENCLSVKQGFFTLFDWSLRRSIEENFKHQSNEIYNSILYLLVYQNYISDLLDDIKFVNPIGSPPRRFYFQEDKKANYTQIDIGTFINTLGSSISTRELKSRISNLNKLIKNFGIAEEIELIKDPKIPVIALNVKTKEFWSNITDVGYGVSLQIPILFQALLSEHTKKGQTLLIEQPEVHLHPFLQAKFIETLLSIGNKNNYFIETHSEHIIRKLQILIKNKTFDLKHSDISIYYFRRIEDKFEISEHTINQFGKLNTNFPSGFYDTSYSLIKELL
jgi:predicted ATPase